MALVASFEDVKHCQFRRQSLVTPFMQASGNALALFQKSGDTRDLVAFLRESEPDMVTQPHYHTVDQFQVMVDGDGVLGRHTIAPYCVHFARAYTPYGPLIGGSEQGVTFFTLRSRADPGANYLPESAGALKAITPRQPWQITRHFRFPFQTGAALSGSVELQAVPDMSDDQGLAAYTLSMAPNGETRAPDPSSSDGQYVIVVKGSLCHEGREHHAYTVVFVAAGDGSLAMRAGAEGLAAIILNFPRHTSITALTHATSRSKKWQCELCAFSYDEAMGLPDDGLAPGTPWADIPEDWTCPDCGAGKGDFKPSAFIDPVKS